MLETYFRIPLKDGLQFSGYIDYIMKFENKIHLHLNLTDQHEMN